MKNLKLFVSSAFIALAFSSIQETQGMKYEDEESTEIKQRRSQSRHTAKVEESLNDDKITNIPRFTVASGQEKEGQYDLANHNYQLAFEEETNTDFRSSSSKESVSEEYNPDEEITVIDGEVINIAEEYEKSSGFKAYHIEVNKFGDFLENCGGDERVLVFGTGHWHEDSYAEETNGWKYPKNAYLADSLDASSWKEAKPDLLMGVEINKVPEEYVGKFNIVIFEGISPDNYDQNKAFQNVNKLLRDGGIFLVYLQMKYKETLYKLLINSGFSFSRVIKESFEYEPEQQYIGKWIELVGGEFYWVWKKERDI